MSVMNIADRTRSGSPGDSGFQHEAMLYDGEPQFVDRAARFVRDGLRGGEAVLVAVHGRRAASLRRALGPDAERVDFLDLDTVGRNPARIIPAWRDWVESRAGAGPGLRGVGESIWAARSSAEIAECQRHEQLLDTAFDDGPDWHLICAYDTSSLPSEVIEHAYRAHPFTSAGDRPRSGAERDRRAGVRRDQAAAAVFASALPEPSAVDHQLEFGRDEMGGVRRGVAEQADRFGLLGQRGEDLVLVASELASNSVRHGGGRGTLRVWQDGADLVCEVSDQGLITDPLVGRRRPVVTAGQGGAGLWITNQLCDLVQIRSTPQNGTVVRVRIALPQEPSRSEASAQANQMSNGRA
ncbi:MAG TPA: sensor histidine kinase [Actinocrinis sp.]|nr:sensor histidine kinase [Actinocrinis sp.]